MKLDGLTVADMLRVEGTDRIEVQTYLLFPAESDMEQADAKCRSLFEGPSNTTLTHLVSDAWRAEIVLVESTIPNLTAIPGSVAQILHSALSRSDCFAAVCMFDGAFYSFEDILSPEMARQTYAFSIRKGAEVVCMSTEVLATPGWAEIIHAQRMALGWPE